MAPEGWTLGIVLKLTRIEHVAPVERQSKGLIQEGLTQTQVERAVSLAVSLRNHRARTVVARSLHRNAVRQDYRSQHTRIPCKVLVALARHGLVLHNRREAIQLVIVGIQRGGEVEDAEELVLQDHLGTGTLTLSHVEVGHIHHVLSLIEALIADALHHVGSRTIVSTDRQRMSSPCLEVVQRESIGELRCQLGVTELNHRGVTRILERVELSAPGTTQTTGDVQLNL